MSLPELTDAIRASLTAEPHSTVKAVVEVLRRQAPGTDLLTAGQLAGDGADFARHVLHAEPAFSVVAVVWRPGQRTPVHDHIAWCAFAVLAGVEHETLFADRGDHLEQIGEVANGPGDVSGFAPPGDIHLVHNTSPVTAVSLHVYGADLSRDPSSVRRTYELPVR